MIDLYYAPTPNGHKITLFLEEAELAYRLIRVDIGKGEQFHPQFLAISPNNKVPAIVDHMPADGGAPLSVFESGAILLYLAEKSGKLLSGELRERYVTLQWLFWQVETQRLYGVLNQRLGCSPWLGGDHYSIADIAAWPWVNCHVRQRIDLANYPAVHNWYERIKQRPATAEAMLKIQLY